MRDDGFWKALLLVALLALTVAMLSGCGSAEEAESEPSPVEVVVGCGAEIRCLLEVTGADARGRPTWRLSCTDPEACR